VPDLKKSLITLRLQRARDGDHKIYFSSSYKAG